MRADQVEKTAERAIDAEPESDTDRDHTVTATVTRPVQGSRGATLGRFSEISSGLAFDGGNNPSGRSCLHDQNGSSTCSITTPSRERHGPDLRVSGQLRRRAELQPLASGTHCGEGHTDPDDDASRTGCSPTTTTAGSMTTKSYEWAAPGEATRPRLHPETGSSPTGAPHVTCTARDRTTTPSAEQTSTAGGRNQIPAAT